MRWTNWTKNKALGKTKVLFFFLCLKILRVIMSYDNNQTQHGVEIKEKEHQIIEFDVLFTCYYFVLIGNGITRC